MSPSVPPSRANGWAAASGIGVDPQSLSLLQIVAALFLRPRVLVDLRRDRLGRAFRIMALWSLLCGTGLGVCRLPRLHAAALDWAQWVRQFAGSVELRSGKLTWDHPTQLPTTVRHDGWRIDVVAAGTDLPDLASLEPETRGVWVAEDRVVVWRRSGGFGRSQIQPLLVSGRLWGAVSVDSVWPDGWRLSGEEFDSAAAVVFRHLAPVVVGEQAVIVFVTALLYALLFAVLPMISRSPLAADGPRPLITFYLYASVPATLVATVYGGLNLPLLDLPLVFVIALVVYLLIAFRTPAADQNSTASPLD